MQYFIPSTMQNAVSDTAQMLIINSFYLNLCYFVSLKLSYFYILVYLSWEIRLQPWEKCRNLL